MGQNNLNIDQYYILHDNYTELVFTDDMTEEDLHAVHQIVDSNAAKWREQKKPILVLVDVSQRTNHNMSLFKEKVQLLDTEGLKAVAIFGQKSGFIYDLAASVISSYSSVTPIKYFSDRNEALAWLRTNQ